MTALHWLLIGLSWLLAALDAALGLSIVWRGTRGDGRPAWDDATTDRGCSPRSLWASFVLATFAVAGCLLAQALVFAVVDGLFAAVRMGYAALAVIPPAAGVGLTWIARRRRGRTPAGLKLMAVLSFAAPGVCAYATLITPFQLVLERADVALAGVPAGRTVRIGVLADLQTDRITAYEQSAVDRLLAEKPDLILIPGDLFQMSRAHLLAQWDSLRGLLNRLDAPGGCFAVLGNVDWPHETAELLAGTPVRLLDDQLATTDAAGVRIAIGGIGLNYRGPAARGVMRHLAAADADVRILLSHLPDAAVATHPAERIDLVVAGHTHGGQIVIPGFGPPVTLSGVPRRVAAGGLHRLDHQLVYVSRGVGHERAVAPRIRLFCPPEITLLRLVAAPGQD